MNDQQHRDRPIGSVAYLEIPGRGNVQATWVDGGVWETAFAESDGQTQYEPRDVKVARDLIVLDPAVIRNPDGLRATLCVRGWSELADVLVPPGGARTDGCMRGAPPHVMGMVPDPESVTVNIPLALARTIRFDGDTLVWHNPDVPGHTVRMPGDGTAPTVERETPPDPSPPIKWTFADQIWRAGDPLTMSEYGMCGEIADEFPGASATHCVLRAEHKGMHHGDDGSDWTA